MKLSKTISILGCGWLGLPLGNTLVKIGFEVKGSTTSPSKIDLLKSNTIEPFLVDLTDEKTLPNIPAFLNSDILIISFPPGIRSGNGAGYIKQINALAGFISRSPVKNILFVSSTSVYPDLNKIITEEYKMPENEALPILIQAENIIQEACPGQVTIIRFSGLVGGNRHPGRFFAGKTQVANPEAPVNLIHLDDCLRIMTEIITQEKWGNIYNACADEHPSRQVFYTTATKALHLTPPEFMKPSPQDSFKIISNAKLKTDLNYQFLHPDPLKFI